jgi:hypothetical protein
MKIKVLLEIVRKILNVVFPKSKWGNVVYLVIGYYLSHSGDISSLITAVEKIFHH